MKLIDYKCEKCGRVVEDWYEDVDWAKILKINKKTDEYNNKERKNGSLKRMAYYYNITGTHKLNVCCSGRIMQPQPWMNNSYPTTDSIGKI